MLRLKITLMRIWLIVLVVLHQLNHFAQENYEFSRFFNVTSELLSRKNLRAYHLGNLAGFGLAFYCWQACWLF